MRKEIFTHRFTTCDHADVSLLEKARLRRLRALQVCDDSHDNLFL